MKTRKIISLLLASLLLLGIIPVYASAAETLNTSNIQTLPTVSMITPEVTSYVYGTTYAEIFRIEDDEVVVDAAGNQVAGHFELKAPNGCWDPSVETLKRVNLVFVPDDTSAYTGFNKNRVSVENYGIKIQKGTMKLADETNDPPVAEGSYPVGTALSDIAITGGAVVNVLNPSANQGISNPVWRFKDAATATVLESGYYEAYVAGVEEYFNEFTYSVYVTVESNVDSVVITELPSVGDVYAGTVYGDIVFEGGKAISFSTGEEIAGKFVWANEYTTTATATVGDKNIPIKFVPDDLEKYTESTEVTLSFTVKAKPIRFVDENGNDIIPEITTIPGAVFGETLSIGYSLMAYMNSKRNTLEYFDMDGNSIDGTKVPIGTHTYQTRVTSKDTNFEPSMLTFVLTLEPTYFNATTRYNYVNHYLTVVPDNKSVTDEFDVWVDGEFLGTTAEQKIKWETDESRDYNVTLVHKDTTEGVYALANTEYTMTVKIPRQIFRSDSGLSFTATGSTYPGNDNYAYKGDVLTLTCTDETFYNWQLSIGGEDWIPEGLTAEDLKKPTITFTMPDSDIFACPNDESRFAAAADCDHLCHSENPIYQMFWKILHFIFRLFNVQQYCDCGMKHYESALFNF